MSNQKDKAVTQAQEPKKLSEADIKKLQADKSKIVKSGKIVTK